MAKPTEPHAEWAQCTWVTLMSMTRFSVVHKVSEANTKFRNHEILTKRHTLQRENLRALAAVPLQEAPHSLPFARIGPFEGVVPLLRGWVAPVGEHE